MNNALTHFIQENHINSFSKLRFLLLLRQRPHLRGCPQQLAEQMYLEAPLVEQLITDLQAVGVLEGKQQGYSLRNEPNLRACLDGLAAAFEHPLTRQELLKQIKKIST